MLQGGLAPLVSYQPVTVTGGNESARAAAPSAAGSGSDLTSKDFLKMLDKLEGLPNDTNAVIKLLQNFYINLAHSMMPNTSSIELQYLSALGQLNNLKFSRKMYDEAYDIVKGNGGLNELAVDSRGYLLCINKTGDFLRFSVEDAMNQSDYKPLTNSELLALRANSPQLAGDTSVLEVVGNGIGMKGILELINQTVSNIGTSSIEKTGYSGKLAGQIINGIELLKEAYQKGLLEQNLDNYSVDGLYKNKLLTKEQTQQAAMALNYVYSMLPENAKTLLKIKSGNKPMELIGLFISSRLDSTSSLDISLDAGHNADGSKKSEKQGTDKSGEQELNPAMMFINDKGAEKELSLKAGTNDTLHIAARVLPAMTHSGNPIGVTTLDKLASDTTFGGILDFNSVSMGDKLIDMENLGNVVINGNLVYKAYLPVDLTKLQEGIKTPNTNYLATMEMVRRDIKSTNAKSPEQINAIYLKYNLPKFVNADGSVNEVFYAPFAVLNGTGLFKSNDDFSGIHFLEVKDETTINSVWKMIKGKDAKEKFDEDNWYDWNGHDEMYRSLVYIPIVSLDPNLASVSGGDSPKLKDVSSNTERYLAMQRLSTFNPAGQL